MKFVLATKIVALSLIVSSCSQGSFHEGRDYFQSIYGMTLSPFNLTGHSFIGRVVDGSGQPIPNSKIFVKGSPLYTESNQKGGFYLSGLQGQENTIYILNNSGLGKALNLNLTEQPWEENDHIVLEKLLRVSGRVTSGAAPIGEAQLSMDGGPFTALSNTEGQFFFELPRGEYSLNVRHLLYNPYEQKALKIEQDLVTQVNLDPLGFPEVQLTLEQASGLIIHGLTTQIGIKKSPSVRYVRIISSFRQDINTSGSTSRWEDIKDRLIFHHQSPGFNTVNLQFMDQFGKMTDPISVSYYNTLYDSSWRLIYTNITDPLVIHKNEKVAFLTVNYPFIGLGKNVSAYSTMGGTSESSGSNESTQPSSMPLPSTYNDLSIEVPVEIEAGAMIRGGAIFRKSVSIHGSATQPVKWDFNDEQGNPMSTLFLEDVVIENAQLKNGTLTVSNHGTTQYPSPTSSNSPNRMNDDKEPVSTIWQNVRTENLNLIVNLGYRDESPSLQLEHFTFINGTLTFSDDPWGKPVKTDAYKFIESDRNILRARAVTLNMSSFNNSSLAMGLPGNRDFSDEVNFQMTHNNFLGNPLLGSYLVFLPSTPNPGKQPLILDASENYFANREIICNNNEQSTILRQKMSQNTNPEAGAHFP